jgi:hypothetical protein
MDEEADDMHNGAIASYGTSTTRMLVDLIDSTYTKENYSGNEYHSEGEQISVLLCSLYP